MRKLILSGIVLLLITVVFSGCQVAPSDVPGYVWIYPESFNIDQNDTFTLGVFVNTGDQRLSAYAFNIRYNPDILAYQDIQPFLDTPLGPDLQPDVEEQGFVSASNEDIPGLIKVTGFDVFGKRPNAVFHLLDIKLKGIGKGYSKIELNIENLIDEKYRTIGSPSAQNGEVTVF